MKISKHFLVMALAIVALSLISSQLLEQTCVSCNSTQSNVTVGYNNNVSSSCGLTPYSVRPHRAGLLEISE